MAQEKLFERIDIVKVKLVKEKIGYYGTRNVRNPEELAAVVRRFVKNSDREVFLAINLNTQNEINSIHVVSMGSVDSSLVHPREVFKSAILANASSIALAHNHPSGNLNPSQEDINITEKLIKCGEILGIKVIDHIIIADNQYTSFREKNITTF
jgi:DNA repair protein RadC